MIKRLELIGTLEEIIVNVRTFHKYNNSISEDERKFYKNKIKSGSNFIYYEENGEQMFCPSKFVGYKGNDYTKFYKDGSYTKRSGNYADIRINKVLGRLAKPDDSLLKELSQIIDINTNRNKKKQCFWILSDMIQLKIKSEKINVESKNTTLYPDNNQKDQKSYNYCICFL